jgi:hypothetical protein
VSLIFINYRREQTSEVAATLYSWLTARYGGDKVFKDKDTIAPGATWRDEIETAVGSASLVLALIGSGWLPELRRRLDDEEDFLRQELETALRLRITVLPVLVGGAEMPGAEDLPDSLAHLADYQALVLIEEPQVDQERLFNSVDRALHRPELRAVQGEYTQTQQPPTELPGATHASKSNTTKPTRARKTVAVPLASLELLEASQDELDSYVRLYIELESGDRTGKAQDLVATIRAHFDENEPHAFSQLWTDVEKGLDEIKLLGSGGRLPADLRRQIEQFDEKVADGRVRIRKIMDPTRRPNDEDNSLAGELINCLYSIGDEAGGIMNECRRQVEERLRSVTNLVNLVAMKGPRAAAEEVRPEVTISQEAQERRRGVAVRTSQEMNAQRLTSGASKWTG